MAGCCFLYGLTCCVLLLLPPQSLAAPVIEAYKPEESDDVAPKRTKMSTKGYTFENNFNRMLRNLEHRIDEAEVRQRIMEAQMRLPLEIQLNPNRIAAALQFINKVTPSIVYNNSKIIAKKTGMLLQIFDDGVVNGTMDYQSPYARLTLEAIGIGTGVIFRIKGTKSQRYLTYKTNGRVVAELKPVEASEFLLKAGKSAKRRKTKQQAGQADGYYDVIQNRKHGWYLGFRHNFKMKKGPLVRLRHKGSRFTVISRVG